MFDFTETRISYCTLRVAISLDISVPGLLLRESGEGREREREREGE